MNIRLFYHSLISDWNHGNAHFLRGIAAELTARGHDVVVYEPADGWSLRHLREAHGEEPVHRFRERFPALRSIAYDPARLDFESALADADLVIVHEWNEPELLRCLVAVRQRHGFVLLFHDTHHRLVTERGSLPLEALRECDGVLAYGEMLRQLYQREAVARRAWTWHEAADTRVFRPLLSRDTAGDVVWIGNWGDGERSEELREFLIEPVRAMRLKARVYGVRYPAAARAMLAEAGIEYSGWIPNFDVPAIFAQFKVTLHIPRRPYVTALPGIPTIRPFEALACGIPLISSPWEDTEGLFEPGSDFLVARNGREMQKHLRLLLTDRGIRRQLTAHGLTTIRRRHTCGHRVDELLQIHREVLRAPAQSAAEVPVTAHLAMSDWRRPLAF